MKFSLALFGNVFIASAISASLVDRFQEKHSPARVLNGLPIPVDSNSVVASNSIPTQ